MRSSQKGFSIPELLIAIILTGVGMALFSMVFVNNWFAYEDRIMQADLMNEANSVIDEMTREGRVSRQINATPGTAQTTVTFFNGLNTTSVVYTLFNDGRLTVTRGGQTRTLTTHLDFANSTMVINGQTLETRLSLTDRVSTRPLRINAGTDITPRN